jgi:hypothetical protein
MNVLAQLGNLLRYVMFTSNISRCAYLESLRYLEDALTIFKRATLLTTMLIRGTKKESHKGIFHRFCVILSNVQYPFRQL